jgi:hypothetical protein
MHEVFAALHGEFGQLGSWTIGCLVQLGTWALGLFFTAVSAITSSFVLSL